ncbi:MAG: hypothetical protein OEW92_02680 [Gammaproteobacteria bacterium]|nr:hypothetical protein [Gammaproteobacteria bacterium]
MAVLGVGLPLAPRSILAGETPAGTGVEDRAGSLFGHWIERGGLPEFVYDADHARLAAALWQPVDRPPTRRHFHVLGNRALQMQVSNNGDIALFDESQGMRWLIYGDDARGSGHSVITEADGLAWGSSYSQRPAGTVPQRIFGCAQFTVLARHQGLQLERAVLCPEGDVPWVLVRVKLGLAKDQATRQVTHTERWALRPRFLHTFQPEQQRDAVAATVGYSVDRIGRRLVAREQFAEGAGTIGEPATIVLEALGSAARSQVFSSTTPENGDHPVLEAGTEVRLEPGETIILWYRIGREDGQPVPDPAGLHERSLASLRRRLPSAETLRTSKARREITWHGAMLSGGANRDLLLGGHTLNQSSIYGFGLGANAAARDALQHALPLVYTEPDLALSVLRNTCAWGSPDGDLPYCLTGTKQPLVNLLRPSDQNLWLFWLASEYAAATGDLAAFNQPQAYHPAYSVPEVTLAEHLARQFDFFVNQVGRGERNHVRLLNADWNDMVLEDRRLDKEQMIARGSSVLNSAMASWVMSIFAPLMEKLGRRELASRARELADELRQLVASSWNGKWYDRAYGPDGLVVGRDRCWLEVQPWAILCGAADQARSRELIELIKTRHCAGSPLGARIVWPPDREHNRVGQGTNGGIWYSINMTLVWAAAGVDFNFAWEQWQAMSLDNHSTAFPHIWEGTLSGPDAWNAPEADRPGHTWTTPLFSMQAYPVNNMHSHSQPLLGYLRLLGIGPQADGSLGILPAGGLPVGSFNSQVLALGTDGHGWLKPVNDITLRAPHGLATRVRDSLTF